MDVTHAIEPKSDQLNSDDLITGSRTFTIERVTGGTDEQPLNVHLVELPGRPYRPSKSMARVLVAAYGPESDNWHGKRATLYRDPDVKFGADKVGGIKISHLSDLKGRLTVSLTQTRGRKANHSIELLPDAPKPAPEPTAEEVEATTDLDVLLRMHAAATSPERKAQIVARGKALKGATA